MSAVGLAVLLKSENGSEPKVLRVLLTVEKTVSVAESKPALGKSPISLVLIKYVVRLVSVMVVLIIR